MRRAACMAMAMTVVCASAAFAGLTRHDVLVIANSNSPASVAVANYYKASRGIPASRVRMIDCPASDSVSLAGYEAIRDQIVAHLQALGSVPNDPGNDPVKAIILCTDVPHYTKDSAERYAAVDSALAALFTQSEWRKEPFGANGLPQPSPGGLNTYCGYYTYPTTFDAYRAGGAAAATYEAFPAPGMTLVRILSSNAALAVGGNGALFRGTKSGATWTWTAVDGRDKAWIAWHVSGLCVLDSTHAYACTGNPIRPHGGGTVIATSDGGLTWSRIRYSSYSGKLKEAFVGIDFATTSAGWAVGSTFASGQPMAPLMIKTINGGSSWTDISASLPSGFYPKAVSAADANNVWICGRGGMIYRSTDGGGSWTPANAGAPSVAYNAIWVKSSAGVFKGWAVGAGGTIVRTEDGSNWTVEASGLTSADIVDLAAWDQDHAYAASDENSMLVFERGTGWRVEAMPLAPVVSAAGDDTGPLVAVGGTRYVFAKGDPGWAVSMTGQDTPWKLRYLVMRLDGYESDVSPADGIPDAVKAIIDRACDATSPGKFVLDEATNIGKGYFEYARDMLTPIVGSSNVIFDNTSTYLMGQTDVIGYTSWAMHDVGCRTVTTWGRPFHSWVNGGIAALFQSSDGRAFDKPYYISSFAQGGTPMAGQLTFSGFLNTGPYNTHRVVLHAADGAPLASAAFNAGAAQIDLGSISWPADHKTYAQMYYPGDDPLHPGEIIYYGRYPTSGSSTAIYDNRAAGFSIAIKTQISLMAEMLHEGATGGIANVAEPWSSYCGQPDVLFPPYAMGFTWGESAYMGLPGIGWQEVVLGDPLMAPFATPPVVTFTNPSADGQIVSGTLQVGVDAAPVDASGINRVEFWLDDDTLAASDDDPPYGFALDTSLLTEGTHTIEAIAFENDEVQNTCSVIRTIVVDRSHDLCPSINDARSRADGARVALERKHVSAVYNGFFYIAEPNRVQGVRVVSSVPVTEGGLVTITGTMQTVDGERRVVADSVGVCSSQAAAVLHLAAVGGRMTH